MFRDDADRVPCFARLDIRLTLCHTKLEAGGTYTKTKGGESVIEASHSSAVERAQRARSLLEPVTA
jgi:hypothetical protein